MYVAALDWNATRVRAVTGPWGEYALPMLLDSPHAELALAITLEKTPTVGAAALGMCREAPNSVCQAFLPHLSEQAAKGPRWQAGRQSLDARAACEIAWRRLSSLRGAEAVVLTTPGYFQPVQADTLRRLGEAQKLPLLGSLPTTLAAALAGHLEQFWQRSVLVVDVDDYALTLGWVTAQAGRAHLIECRSITHLGLRMWRDRLISSLADLFVWQHRRDPRDLPHGEQGLYDQLDVLIDASAQNRAIQLGVQGREWFKHLLVHPEQSAQFCQPLVNKVVAEADHLLLSCPAGEAPRGILLTHEAGRLPGLRDALKSVVQPGPTTDHRRGPKSEFHEEDFGESLLLDDQEEPSGVLVLSADAPARAAHGLLELFSHGALPSGHLESIVPLPPPLPVDSGPPRLYYQGRDYLLREGAFVVGKQFGCHLCLDKNEHPDVAPRHCEIVYERRAFTLYNRSRETTLVNDRTVAGSVVLRAGDQIRLGLRGPVVRFLGKTLPRAVHAVIV